MMKIKYLTIIVLMIVSGCTSLTDKNDSRITTGTLLDEMTDLNRLTLIPDKEYRLIQFSSYDRRSIKAGEPGWFSNSDGFGEEPVPGFEKVLREPDAGGTGEYLICDVQEPGAILRLWTAGINGRIRLFLDNMRKPVFEGEAQEFFWKTIESLSHHPVDSKAVAAFRQSDGYYFPVPFKKSCRIEWIGNTKDIHFYHVTIRTYPQGTKIRRFKPEDIRDCASRINEVASRFGSTLTPDNRLKPVSVTVNSGKKETLFEAEGERAFDELRIKIVPGITETNLRNCILTINFDDSPSPQIQAPLGDFFGSAPGLAEYNSLPFTILPDSTMVCRFLMPFRNRAKIEIENFSGSDIHIIARIGLAQYKWIDGKSMHFNACWKIDHGLTASDSLIADIPYLQASGKGRLVGAAAYIYNPSNVPTSWGNWWGEGDEKIFIDRDTFPSFFGTGTEDYFNYSWSSDALFSFPYCGQTRNDGPGNRGYVSNYRWHIADDIPFYDRINFSVELWHHGAVDNFSYGRITYFYALPGLKGEYRAISPQDVAVLPYGEWMPEAYLGSSGYSFIQAEDLIPLSKDVSLEKGKMCAGGSIISWTPGTKKQSVRYRFLNRGDTIPANLGFTLIDGPGAGEIAVYLNGTLLKFNGREFIKLNNQKMTVLRNYFSEKTRFKNGWNEIVLENRSREENSRIGIDFMWLRNKAQ